MAGEREIFANQVPQQPEAGSENVILPRPFGQIAAEEIPLNPDQMIVARRIALTETLLKCQPAFREPVVRDGLTTIVNEATSLQGFQDQIRDRYGIEVGDLPDSKPEPALTARKTKRDDPKQLERRAQGEAHRRERDKRHQQNAVAFSGRSWRKP